MTTVAWLRQRLFATPLDAAITLVCLYIVWRISVPLAHWLLLDATWNGTSRDDCKGAGACWVFVRMRFGQFMYGQYPLPERWRVDVVGGLWVLATVVLAWRNLPHRSAATLATAVVLPPLGIVLLHGGWGTGLKLVETREWGGLMLTLFLTVYAGLIAIPLGILLALGRRSRLPLIRFISVVFIEFWRGVPIITVIFRRPRTGRACARRAARVRPWRGGRGSATRQGRGAAPGSAACRSCGAGSGTRPRA
jgi:general L-amino acid transport system permease protein